MKSVEDPISLNTVYASDCVDFMRRLDSNFVDLTVTSPPYDNLRDYKGFSFEFSDIAKELYRITKPGGVVVWVVGDKIKKGNRSLTSFRHALLFQTIGFNVHDVMLYKKKTHHLCVRMHIPIVMSSCLYSPRDG